MTSDKIRFVDKRSGNEGGEAVGTALKGMPAPLIGAPEEPNTLPVPEHLHRLWLALGLDEHEITTVRLGAYLHDVGKIRVPHEILNKPGRLTNEEFDVIKMHPIWGLELLEQVEFPWDIKPIIRWHHEKYDGNGYPDRLRGEEIPVNAMIIGIVDVYDALTTSRSYRGAMPPQVAVAEMDKMRRSWRDDVYQAFCRAVAEPETRLHTEALATRAA